VDETQETEAAPSLTKPQLEGPIRTPGLRSDVGGPGR
jgi:hypothetical protein